MQLPLTLTCTCGYSAWLKCSIQFGLDGLFHFWTILLFCHSTNELGRSHSIISTQGSNTYLLNVYNFVMVVTEMFICVSYICQWNFTLKQFVTWPLLKETGQTLLLKYSLALYSVAMQLTSQTRKHNSWARVPVPLSPCACRQQHYCWCYINLYYVCYCTLQFAGPSASNGHCRLHWSWPGTKHVLLTSSGLYAHT